MKGLEANRLIALCDQRATRAGLAGRDQRKIVYTGEQGFGGNNRTEEIRTRYGLSSEHAGLAKRQRGLPEGYEPVVLTALKQAMAQQIAR